MMRFSFPSKHALGLFLIKTCLFSLTTCKAVPFLTSAFLFGYLTNFKTSVLSNNPRYSLRSSDGVPLPKDTGEVEASATVL